MMIINRRSSVYSLLHVGFFFLFLAPGVGSRKEGGFLFFHRVKESRLTEQVYFPQTNCPDK